MSSQRYQQSRETGNSLLAKHHFPSLCAVTRRVRSNHSAFDLRDRLGHTRRKHLMSVFGYEDIVFDANADSSITRVDAFRVFCNVESRLDRHHHTRRKPAPFVGYLIRTCIVHIHPEPVTRAMHEELLERALLDELVDLAFKQAEPNQSLGQDACRAVARLDESRARPNQVNRFKLGIQHELI